MNTLMLVIVLRIMTFSFFIYPFVSQVMAYTTKAILT